MGATLALSWLHGQEGLRAVEHLDLRLLVHTQNQGVVRGVHVEADDLTDLVDQPGVGRELEVSVR
jgi:hypothetical protein